MPSVAFIIPLHNRAAELPQTLDALLAQTSGDWEAVIVDDHSTDGAADVARGYAARDARFKVVPLPDPKRGAPAGRNLGVSESTAEFVIFLDSDDLVAPTCVERRVAYMRANTALDFAVWQCQLFREQPGDVPLLWNADTGEDDLDRLLKNDVPWQTTSPIWRRSAFAKFATSSGEFWDESVLSGQDWEFHIRAVASGLKFDRVAEIDCHWRVAGPARESIGKSSFIGPSHVRARPAVIDKMARFIEARGVMTPARRRMFGAMTFRAAEAIADRFSRVEARKVWATARRSGFVTAAEARQGGRYLFLKKWPAIAAGERVKIARTWPAELLTRRGKFFNRAPVDPSRPPTISVLTSAYNNAEYIEAAVDSILGQTFGDFEFIIVDDGSTDGTGELLQQYADSDCRVRLIRRANKGLTVSLNEALGLARGEFIARMDGDDIADRERFAKQVAFLREHPQVVALGTRIETIDPFDVPIERPLHSLDHDTIDRELMAGSGWALVHPTVMFRAAALRDAGGYKDHYNGCEDFELFLRLAERGKVANLPDVLLKYRQHLGSVNHTKYLKQRAMKMDVLREAYGRRGAAMPAEFHFADRTHVDAAEQYRFWGWRALKQGKVEPARRAAWRAIRVKPFSLDNWRLLRCALRGH